MDAPIPKTTLWRMRKHEERYIFLCALIRNEPCPTQMISCNYRKGGAETPEEGIDERMPGGFVHHGDLCDTPGGMEIDGDPGGETWHSQESSDSEFESELFVHSEHSEDMSDDENDYSGLGDEIDVTEEENSDNE